MVQISYIQLAGGKGMDLRISGKVAVVGGASRGIGFAIAKGLAFEGAKVVIAAPG